MDPVSHHQISLNHVLHQIPKQPMKLNKIIYLSKLYLVPFTRLSFKIYFATTQEVTTNSFFFLNTSKNLLLITINDPVFLKDARLRMYMFFKNIHINILSLNCCLLLMIYNYISQSENRQLRALFLWTLTLQFVP